MVANSLDLLSRKQERCDVVSVNCLKDEKGMVKVTLGEHKGGHWMQCSF